MIFKGFSRVFSTANNEQYDTIGAFWDEMSARFGMENLQGLGFNWTSDTIEYAIGLKTGEAGNALVIPCAEYKEIALPDDGWTKKRGRAEMLSELYDEVYLDGPLKYEIEVFYKNGDCEILFCR